MESTRAALALGYGSTPVLIVGGRQVLGAIDLAELEQIIVSELNKQRVRAPNI
jgi:protein-disulfide isomerase